MKNTIKSALDYTTVEKALDYVHVEQPTKEPLDYIPIKITPDCVSIENLSIVVIPDTLLAPKAFE